MMTVEQFKTYVREGLGRAIILLKEQDDKTPYRQPLIDLITSANVGGRLLGQYEVDLINCFEDKDKIIKEIGDNILSQEDFILMYVPLLMLLGLRKDLLEKQQRKYSDSYTQLVEYTKKGKADDQHPLFVSEYFSSATLLLNCDIERYQIKKILWDMADLYHYSDSPIITESLYRSPLISLNGYTRDILIDLLNEVSNEHPCGSIFRKNYEFPLKYEAPPKPLKSITVQDILESQSVDKDYKKLYVTFRQADNSVVREVAKRILEETDRKRQLHWLSFFTTAISTDFDPPAFPLDPTPLIEIVEELKYAFYEKEYVPDVDDAVKYLSALIHMRHPAVKAFAKKILEDKDCPKRLRNYALEMFFCSNYTPKDREAFTQMLLCKGSPDRNVLFIIYGKLIAAKLPDVPLDLIAYVFKEIGHTFLRHQFVNTLIEADVLPLELKNECRFDADMDTRELINNYKE